MKTTRLMLLAVLLAAISASVACGGGSSSSNPNPPAGTFSNANLKGNYTFLAIGGDTYGFNNYGGPGNYQVGGVIVADGSGHITGGEQTYDNVFAVTPDPVTGTYSINSNGMGTMTLNTGDTNIGINQTGTETFSILMLSASKALITQFDSSATSSGSVDLQTSTVLPTGGYAFSVVGADVANNVPLSFGGVFNVDNNPTTGFVSGAGSVFDINDGGSLSLSQSLLGAVTSPDLSTTSPDAFGKVAISLTVGSTGVVFDGYITDASHIQLVEDDSFGITGGTAIGQGAATGTFTANSAFSGNFVYGFSGYNIAGTGADAGILTADGAGTLNSGPIDQNLAGSAITDTLSGTYTVDNTGTGRVVATTTFGTNGTGPNLIFYLTGNGNPVPMQQVDIFALASGAAYPQASGTPSFNGTYGVGFDLVDPSFLESDGTAQVTANSSAGTFSGTANINEDLSPTSAQTFNGTCTSITGGRADGTITVNSGTPINSAFYFVDSTRGFIIENDSQAVTLGVFRQQIAP